MKPSEPSVAARYVHESRAEQNHIVMPTHLNGAGRLFGGQLALWIDEVAGIVAQRHCNRQITTAAIENLVFHEGVYQNTMVVLQGRMTYVGNTSMEVRVDSYAEELSGERRLINTAFVIEVALDENDKACRVPGLLLDNAQEEQDFEAGKIRKEYRIRLAKEHEQLQNKK